MLLPLAHAGHVLVDILIYGSPVIIGIIALKFADKKAREEDAEDDASGDAETDAKEAAANR